MRDDFQTDQLGRGWRWVREDAAHWNLTARPGWLRIVTQFGSLYRTEHNDQRNLLLVDPPGGQFELRTRLDFHPEQDFQAAGLIAYQDDDNYVLLERAFSSFAVGDGIYLDLEWRGDLESQCRPVSGRALELRLARDASEWVGYFRLGTGGWEEVGRLRDPGLGIRGVGLFGTNGGVDPLAAEIPADFAFFEVNPGR